MMSSFSTRQRVNSGRETPVMTTLRAIFTAFAPEYLERYPQLPLSHRKVISAIQHCQSGHYGHSLYQCPSCGDNTASIIPVAIVIARSVSIIKPSSGYPTTWRNSFPGRTSSSPSPFLRRSDPSSARISASLTKPCSKPLLSPSNGSPQTNVSSVRTSLVLSVSCIPGAGSSSTTPTSTTSSLAVASQRTAQSGCPPEPTSLSPCKPSHPSTAPCGKRRCAQPDCWSTSTPRSGTSPGTSTVRPSTTDTPPSHTSPPMSSGSLSPIAASSRSRTAPSLSPIVSLEVYAHEPPTSTPWSLSAGSSNMSCPMAS